ncbi:hypothetical protein ACFLUY_03605, partial [Chloroflexota bacterium]
MIIKNYTFDRLIAMSVLCLGLVLIFVSILLHFLGGIHLLIAVSFGAFIYLLFEAKSSTDIGLPEFRWGGRTHLLSHIVFFISISLIIYIMWDNLYYRPLSFFLLVLVASSSIILNIFLLDESRKSNTVITLVEIIVLALVVYSGIYYQFPGVIGVDPWLHNQWIQETVNIGHITDGEHVSNDYSLFPTFHISSGVMQIVSGLPTRTATMLSTGVLMLVSCAFIFLIGNKLANTKVGLFAALIFLLSDEFISRGTAIIAMSLALCFFLPVVYLILVIEKSSVSVMILVILLSTVIVLTHTIGASITLLSIIAVFFAIQVFRKYNHSPKSNMLVSSTLITFLSLGMISRWMQPSVSVKPFFDMNISNLVDAFRYESQFVMAGPEIMKNVAFSSTIFNKGGYILILAFAVIGALTWLQPRNLSRSRMELISIAGVLMILSQSLEIFSLSGLLPARWAPFTYVVLIPLAVLGLIRTSNLLSGKILQTSMVMIVTLAIIFMMTTSKIANSESPLIFNGVIRIGYTQSELTAINTLSDIGAGRPITDNYYARVFPYIAGYDKYAEMLQRESRVFIKRNYYLNHPDWNNGYMDRILIGGSQKPNN